LDEENYGELANAELSPGSNCQNKGGMVTVVVGDHS